jgi:hypothetical protein
MTIFARPGRTAATLAAIGALTLGPVLAEPAAATAPARVTITPGTADPEYATRLSLRGAGFQAVKGGFGGVYVVFGWVDARWRPSQGGVSGQDFVYVQDSEDKNNHGYQRFVSFENGGTLSAANGGVVRADGTWATTLIVPGATFPAQGRDGGVRQVDCRAVRCGVITFGAHGVVSPQNETFTPVTFAVPTKTSASRPPAGRSRTSPAGGVVIGSAASSRPPVAASRAPEATAPSLRPAAAASGDSGSTGWWVGGLAGGAALVALGVGLARRRRGPDAGGPA